MGRDDKQQRRSRGQAGLTLIEVVIVMAIAVPVVLAAATGLLVTLRLSANTEQQQRTEAQATAYAESLKQIDYEPCATPGDYLGDPSLWNPTEETQITYDIVAIHHWDQDAREYNRTTCGADDDGGAQLIEVMAEGPDRVTTLEVVKRDPDAFASAEGGTP